MKKITLLNTSSLLLLSIVVLFSQACNTIKTLPENVSIEQTYTVKAGELINIVLKSNPSTGFKWNLEEDYDKKVVTFEKEEYVMDQAEPEMLGVGGNETYTFKSIKKGETYIVLKYKRHNQDEAAQTKAFKIVVNK